MAGGISPLTRQTVLTRDDFTCCWCGRRLNISYDYYSLQHRRARGAGGSRLAWINSAENLVLVCGSATSPHCHQHIESHPDAARSRGFRLGFIESAAAVPVIDYNGDTWFLYPEGHRSMFAPTLEGSLGDG